MRGEGERLEVAGSCGAAGVFRGETVPDGRTFCALLLTDELCRMNKL